MFVEPEDVSDQLFDNPTPRASQLKITSWRTRRFNNLNVADTVVNGNQRLKEARLLFAEKLRFENQRMRQPCPTCGNLVKPELQNQHNDACHSVTY